MHNRDHYNKKSFRKNTSVLRNTSYIIKWVANNKMFHLHDTYPWSFSSDIHVCTHSTPMCTHKYTVSACKYTFNNTPPTCTHMFARACTHTCTHTQKQKAKLLLAVYMVMLTSEIYLDNYALLRVLRVS